MFGVNLFFSESLGPILVFSQSFDQFRDFPHPCLFYRFVADPDIPGAVQGLSRCLNYTDMP